MLRAYCGGGVADGSADADGGTIGRSPPSVIGNDPRCLMCGSFLLPPLGRELLDEELSPPTPQVHAGTTKQAPAMSRTTKDARRNMRCA